MTQTERLLERLREYPVTPLDSWVDLGIYRLAARVFDLRNQGHDIEKTMTKVRNKFGETVKVAEYRLRGE